MWLLPLYFCLQLTLTQANNLRWTSRWKELGFVGEDWVSTDTAHLHFKKLGRLDRGVGYAHLTFNVDFSIAAQEVATWCKALADTHPNIASLPNRTLKWYANMSALIVQRCEDHVQDFRTMTALWTSTLSDITELQKRTPNVIRVTPTSRSPSYEQPRQESTTASATTIAPPSVSVTSSPQDGWPCGKDDVEQHAHKLGYFPTRYGEWYYDMDYDMRAWGFSKTMRENPYWNVAPLNVTQKNSSFVWNCAESSISSRGTKRVTDIWERRREKRQLFVAIMAAIVAVGSALYSASDLVGISQGSDSHTVVKHFHDDEIKLASQERSLAILNSSLVTLSNQVRDLSIELEVVSRFHHISLMTEGILDKWDRLQQGLGWLAQHRLSPRLIDAQSLSIAIKEVARMAEHKGLRLDVKEADDAYSFPVSYLSFKNNTIRVFLHIPVVQPGTPLDVYHYTPTPVQITNNTIGLPLPTRRYLITNPSASLFSTLSDLEFSKCSVYGERIACPTAGVYYTRAQDDCLAALFHVQLTKINDLCMWRFDLLTPIVTQLYGNLFSVYFPIKERLTLLCPDSQQSVSFQGVRTIFVPPTCTASSDHFLLYGEVDFWRDTTVLIGRTFPSADLLNFAGFTDQTGLDEALKDLRLIGSNEGISITRIKLHAHQSFRQSILNLIMQISLPIIVLFIAFLCCYSARKHLWRMWDTCLYGGNSNQNEPTPEYHAPSDPAGVPLVELHLARANP